MPLSSLVAYPEILLVLVPVLEIVKPEFEDEEENEDDYDVPFVQITRRPTTEMSPRAMAATHLG